MRLPGRGQGAPRNSGELLHFEGRFVRAKWSRWGLVATCLGIALVGVGIVLVLAATPGRRGDVALLQAEYAWIGLIVFCLGLGLSLAARRYGVRVTPVVDELDK